jgi:hypothetical protein
MTSLQQQIDKAPLSKAAQEFEEAQDDYQNQGGEPELLRLQNHENPTPEEKRKLPLLQALAYVVKHKKAELEAAKSTLWVQLETKQAEYDRVMTAIPPAQRQLSRAREELASAQAHLTSAKAFVDQPPPPPVQATPPKPQVPVDPERLRRSHEAFTRVETEYQKFEELCNAPPHNISPSRQLGPQMTRETEPKKKHQQLSSSLQSLQNEISESKTLARSINATDLNQKLANLEAMEQQRKVLEKAVEAWGKTL